MIFNPTPSQSKAYDMVASGANTAITGPGGVGKSYLIKMLGTLPGTVITSTTAITAGNIGGATFNSWMGAGLGLDSSMRMASKMTPFRRQQIRSAKRVIVDEVSMLHPDLMDKTNEVCKKIRGDDKPFGGLQMISVGDFYQLPPVDKAARRGAEPRYCFESEAWKECDFQVCHLTEMMRQSDEEFQIMLNAIRIGELDGVDLDPLHACRLDDPRKRKGVFTMLDSHNAEVDTYNQEILESMPGEEKVFVSEDRGLDFLVKNSNLPKKLHLKIGCTCLYLHNDDPLFNGSVGTVVDFQDGQPIFEDQKTGDCFLVGPVKREVYQGTETVQVTACDDLGLEGQFKTVDGEFFDEKEVVRGSVTRPKVVASRSALPLRLGYAITIHKSQGMGISCLHARVSRCFSPGHLYTALSRAETLKHLTTSEIRSFSVSQKVKEFYGHN